MRLEISVHPGSKRDSVEALDEGKLKVRVTARPRGGEANEAVVVLLAAELDLPRSRIRIVRGHTARTKLVEVDGLEPKDATLRLRRPGRG